MKLNKKNNIQALGVIGFAVMLGSISIQADAKSASAASTYEIKRNIEVKTSAGVNAAIQETVLEQKEAEAFVYVMNKEKILVGQGQTSEIYGYTNLGIAIVEGNLNIRKEPNTNSKIVGKMTNNAACEIIGEENGFYHIQTGKAEGYVSVDYIVTGNEALNIAKKEATKMATVTTEALRVREAASTESETLVIVNKEDDFVVIEELDGWIKIEVDNHQGYISADYASVETRLKTGNTMEELQFGQGVSQTRMDLVNYALQFVGNRYVWGGESLTNGVDCSGFSMKVYQKFGISLPHYSGSQPSYGTKVTKEQMRPGDLIFYGNGSRINHVAIYIGNNQVVHASNERDGIKISKAFYRTPVCIVSYLP